MKSIGRLLIVVAIVIAANLIFWPKKAALVDHTEKPTGRYTQRKSFEQNLEQYKPQIVLMGNSMLTYGIDSRAFTSYVQKRTLRFSRGGSASAWWYLGLKNVIAESHNKPKVVVVFFRDHYLTKPEYRVNDTFKLSVNDMANDQEPLLDRLAYLNGMDYPTYLLSKISPLFQQKDNLRKNVESFIKTTCVANLLGSNTETIDAAMTTVFDKRKMNQQRLTASQQAEQSKASKDKVTFQNTVKKSFLPHMIDIAEKNDIHLVFVRVKRRRDIIPNSQSQHIKNYMVSIQAYLTAKNIELFDFSDDQNLTLEHYADGDHLNPTKGKPLFTKMVANALMPIIKEHCK